MFCKLFGKRISGNPKFCDSVRPLVVWLLVAALTLFLSTWATAQQSKKVLTNADVVSMVKAGLAESTIILAIQHSPNSFDTSPQALIELKTKGISQRILDAMLTASYEGGASAPERAVRGRARAGPSQPVEEPPRALDSASLVSRVVASLGDPHVLASLKAIRYTTEISAGTDANTVKVEVTQTRIYPDRLVLITHRPGGLETHLEASPAGAFTQVSGGPKINLPAETRDELLKIVRRDRFYIGQNVSRGKVTVTESGTERIGDVETTVLRLKVDGADATWYVSRADGKLLRTVAKVPAATGLVESVVDYSDWRSCDGLVIPFQYAITEGGKFSRARVLTVELNPNMAAREIATRELTESPAIVLPPSQDADLKDVQTLADGFYYKAPEGWRKLSPLSASGSGLKHVGRTMATDVLLVPIFTSHSVENFRGAEAPTQISERRPTFCVKQPTLPGMAEVAGMTERDLVIVRLDKKKDHRELQTTSGSSIFTFKAGVSKNRLPEIVTKRLADGLFLVTPAQDLKPGEYLLTFSTLGGSGYDFGIKDAKEK